MTDTCECARRKRYQVYSETDDGAPLLIDGFDLPQMAQQCIDRIMYGYSQLPRELHLRRPRVYMVDTWDGTAELAGECRTRSTEEKLRAMREIEGRNDRRIEAWKEGCRYENSGCL